MQTKPISVLKLADSVIWYGLDKPLPESTELQAGPLNLIFEQGDLRYIRWGGREIIRRIYMAVRGSAWETVTPQYSDLKISTTQDSFRITFSVINKNNDIHLAWRGSIEGHSNGTIEYSMDGSALSSFLCNRIGLCVLYPATVCKGAACKVWRQNSPELHSILPENIEPFPLFSDMTGFCHDAGGGRMVNTLFEGDLFEMEDQRNWGDATFKAYSTPLRFPIPMTIKQGSKILQRVTISIDSPGAEVFQKEDRQNTPVRIGVGMEIVAKLPLFGLSAGDAKSHLSSVELERLSVLNLSYIRIDIDSADPNWQQRLSNTLDLCGRTQTSIEIGLLPSVNHDHLTQICALLKTCGVNVVSWLLLDQTDAKNLSAIIAQLRQVLSGSTMQAPIGVGTSNYFTELNRLRPAAKLVEVAGFAFCPQVHATDYRTFIENCGSIATIVETTKQFLGVTPLSLGPVSLRSGKRKGITTGLPDSVDPCQMSLIAAGWICGFIQAAADPVVTRMTLFEIIGWKGIMELKIGSIAPHVFFSIPGSVFPVYHILADIGEFKGGSIVALDSSDPLKSLGLALIKGSASRIIVANLLPKICRIELKMPMEPYRQRILSATNAVFAMEHPEKWREESWEKINLTTGEITLDLQPCSIVTLDCWAK